MNAHFLDIDIRDVTNGQDIADILKQKVIVVLKNQTKATGHFTNFVSKIGPIANWPHMAFDPITGEDKYSFEKYVSPEEWEDWDTYPVQRVTGEKVNGKMSGIFGSGKLDWHANLNGPTRADGVALQGYRDCENTSTSWVNTNKAYNEMPQELIDRCDGVYAEYQYSPENWAGDEETVSMITQYVPGKFRGRTKYKMWLIQENAAGYKGIYFYTNNDCKIITNDTKLYDDLYDHIFQEKYMYTHMYEVGDIVLSDQLLSLHKRDQNDEETLSKRVLHRITFGLSNTRDRKWIEEKNIIHGEPSKIFWHDLPA